MHQGISNLRKLYGFVKMVLLWECRIDWPVVIEYLKKTRQYDICLEYVLSGAFLFGWEVPDAFSVNNYERVVWSPPIDKEYREKLGKQCNVAGAKLNDAMEELRAAQEGLSKSNAEVAACQLTLESTREELAVAR